jgi:hypothetical protein
MRKIIFITAAVFAFILGSCGPAAEDREMMHKRAKVFQDSIANAIRAQMAEAEPPSTATIPGDTSARHAQPAQSQKQ